MLLTTPHDDRLPSEHIYVGILKSCKGAPTGSVPSWGLVQRPGCGWAIQGSCPGETVRGAFSEGTVSPLTGANSVVVGAEREHQSPLSDPSSVAFRQGV